MVRSKRFDWCDEDGSTTILSLFLFLIALILGGLAIDFNKVISERTQLQVAADSAAHAALYTREKNGLRGSCSKGAGNGHGYAPRKPVREHGADDHGCQLWCMGQE